MTYTKLKHRVNDLNQLLDAIISGCDGVEIDVRLAHGDVVVSHDSTDRAWLLVQFIHHLRVSQVLKQRATKFTVAINVKENGLAPHLAACRLFPLCVDWYYFDVPPMEFPAYFKAGLPVYGRLSKYDDQCLRPELLAGIQVDTYGMTDYDIIAAAERANKMPRLPVSMISRTLFGEKDEKKDLQRFHKLKYLITKEVENNHA